MIQAPATRRTLWRGADLATLVDPAAGINTAAWGWITDGAIVTDGPRLEWVGPAAQLPAGLQVDEEHD